MPAIPFVGKCFATADAFLDYLEGIKFGVWRPRFVVMHHSGWPNLKKWEEWQRRSDPVTDDEWMRNLAAYYGSSPASGGPADGPWRAGPHFFFTPRNYCVLSLPDRRGVHARSFNALSWGVECVGDFDSEPFTPELRDRYAAGLAALHVAAALAPGRYERGVRGLHFHRDDPKTSKTCPGLKVGKDAMVEATDAAMLVLTGGGDHPDELAATVTKEAVARAGKVAGVAATDRLNMRAEASARSPVVGSLVNGATIMVLQEAMNGQTKWYQVAAGGKRGWVAARFTDVK